MKQCIKSILIWFNSHPKIKEWTWFILLGVGGMLAFLIVAYPIKLLIRSLG